jgi:hypothetical protein
MSITNQFQVLSEEESKKKSNINAPFQEYQELCRAIERGESWYDIMYPRNQDVVVDNSECIDSAAAGKKRPRPITINDIPRDIKKPRYD